MNYIISIGEICVLRSIALVLRNHLLHRDFPSHGFGMSSLSKNDRTKAMQNLFTAYEDEDADVDESAKLDIAISDDDNEPSDRSDTINRLKPRERHFDIVASLKFREKESSDGFIQPDSKKAKLDRTATATCLVSYGPDDQDGEAEEDEDDFEDASDVGNDIFSKFRSSSGIVTYNGMPMTPEEINDSLTRSLRHSLSEDDVQIPPEPSGSCSMRVQTKIAKMYEKVLRTGKDMNATIEQRKEFRNPSIYDKLIEYCSIDEKGTNYPPELFNPTIWSEDSSYEILAQIQRAEMDKREKERREKKEKSLTVERVQGTKKPFLQSVNPSSPTSDQKRKSKWDTASTDSSAATTAAPLASMKIKSFP